MAESLCLLSPIIQQFWTNGHELATYKHCYSILAAKESATCIGCSIVNNDKQDMIADDMANRAPTLVLGGTGKTGRRVVERLAARDLPVRVAYGVRNS